MNLGKKNQTNYTYEDTWPEPTVCLRHLDIPAIPVLLFFMLFFQLKLNVACKWQQRRMGGKKRRKQMRQNAEPFLRTLTVIFQKLEMCSVNLDEAVNGLTADYMQYLTACNLQSEYLTHCFHFQQDISHWAAVNFHFRQLKWERKWDETVWLTWTTIHFEGPILSNSSVMSEILRTLMAGLCREVISNL